MHIDVIDEFDAFERLKEDWNRAYTVDPLAQFYLSWTWMAQWLPLLKNQWFI